MMNERCNGCGRRKVVLTTFRCLWPDGHLSVERHCHLCRLTWHRQLRSLGVKVTEIDENGAEVPLDDISARQRF